MNSDNDAMRTEYKGTDFTILERGKFYEKAVRVTTADSPEADGPPHANPAGDNQGSVAATLALLRSPEFLALPKAEPEEVEQRIQELRTDWEGPNCDQPSSP